MRENTDGDLLESGDLENLRRDAEAEMGRKLWEADDGAPTEQYDPGREIGRFKYDAVKDLERGVRGYLIRCRFRRERTSIREVTERLNAALNGEKKLGVVKLSFRGMAMLLEPSDGAGTEDDEFNKVMHMVQRLMESAREHGLLYTHRVSPILESCVCTEPALEEKGKRLVGGLLDSDVFPARQESAIKFAISFSGRGSSKEKGDRLKFIHAVAKGFSEEYASKTGSQASVDLKHPDIVVSVDRVDVMQRGFMVLGAYPFSWCEGVSKLHIRSLISQNRPAKRKHGEREDRETAVIDQCLHEEDQVKRHQVTKE